jgi:hypothetical protein
MHGKSAFGTTVSQSCGPLARWIRNLAKALSPAVSEKACKSSAWQRDRGWDGLAHLVRTLGLPGRVGARTGREDDAIHFCRLVAIARADGCHGTEPGGLYKLANHALVRGESASRLVPQRHRGSPRRTGGRRARPDMGQRRKPAQRELLGTAGGTREQPRRLIVHDLRGRLHSSTQGHDRRRSRGGRRRRAGGRHRHAQVRRQQSGVSRRHAATAGRLRRKRRAGRGSARQRPRHQQSSGSRMQRSHSALRPFVRHGSHCNTAGHPRPRLAGRTGRRRLPGRWRRRRADALRCAPTQWHLTLPGSVHGQPAGGDGGVRTWQRAVGQQCLPARLRR